MKTRQVSILMVGNHFHDTNHNVNAWQAVAAKLSDAGIHVITTSNKPHRFARLVDMAFTIVTKRNAYHAAQVDIFSGAAFFWGFISVTLLRILQKPTIITLHGGNLPLFSKRHPRLLRYLLRIPEEVTAPSAYLLNALKHDRHDIRLIPNAIDISNYPFVQRINVQPNLIWLRAFHEIYNPSLAVEVIARLKAKHPNITLTMIGPDKGDGSLQRTQEQVQIQNLQDCIQFPGKAAKNEVPQRLNRGDIFLNTTNFDNTPISVMEAMACGLCVVSTNVGGLPYLIDDEVDGLLVPPNDPDALAAAVERVLSEPGLAQRLSTNARAKVENFDWSKVLPEWEKVIESLT